MADLSTATDALLAGRSADGDTIAFAVLVRRHNSYLRAFAIRLTGSHADADDVVQEALISAWSALPGLEDKSKVRAWLVSIVSRKASDRIRSRKPTAELDEREPDVRGAGPEDRAVATSRLDALGRVLAELPEGQRQCWVLKEVAGLSYDEIADELGTNVTIVRGKPRARSRNRVERNGGMAMNDDETAPQGIGGTGYGLDDLSDYLDRGREPAIPEIDENAECQAMLASLDRVGSLSQQLIARDAAALPAADESWLASLLTTIGLEVRAGRDIPLTTSDPTTSLVITEGAIRELIRAAGDSVDGVLVGTCAITGDIAEPGAHVSVAVTISVVLSAPVRELAQAVRERVHSELLAHTELTVDEIDVTVTDVHQLTGAIEENDK